MKIRDCIKRFDQGMGKVIAPAQTYRMAFEKIEKMKQPILGGLYEVTRPSGIPQFRFIASDYHQKITTKPGSNGKGHTRDQALASGIMELAERFSCYKFLNTRKMSKIASFKSIEESDNLFKLRDFYSSCMDGMFENIPLNEEVMDAQVRWYPAYNLSGESLYLPSYLIRYLIHGSNGMAAGNTHEEALVQGICEVIERHCKAMILTKKLSVPHICITTVKEPIAKRLIQKFQKLGHDILIKDFSLGIGVPVIGVIRLADKESCYITAGVATSKYEALIRALTENSQVESERNKFPIRDVKYLFQNRKSISMETVPQIVNRNLKVELEHLEDLLKRQQMRIFFHETTDKELGIPATITYVTGAKHFHESMVHKNIFVAILEDHLETNRCEDAIHYIDKFQQIDRKNANIYEYYRGYVLLLQQDYEKAKASFRKVREKIHTKSFRVKILFGIGWCCQAEGKKDEAVNFYSKILDLNPEFRVEQLNLYGYLVQSSNHNLRNQFLEAKILFDEVSRKKLSKVYVLTTKEGVDKTVATEDEVIEFLKMTGEYTVALNELKERKIKARAARKKEIEVTPDQSQKMLDAFRIKHNLKSSLATYKWLESVGISLETLDEFLETNLLVSKFNEHSNI